MPDIDIGKSPTQLMADEDARLRRLADLESGAVVRSLEERLAAAERERDNLALKLRGRSP